MHKGFLSGAVILFLVSLVCIVGTVVEVILGKTSMGSGSFWGAVAFHATTAVVASVLLIQAHGPQRRGEEEEVGQ